MPGMKRSFFGRARALGLDNDGDSGISGDAIQTVSAAGDHFEPDLDTEFDIDSFTFASVSSRKPPRPSLKRRPTSRTASTSKHTVSTRTPSSDPSNRLSPLAFTSRYPRTPRPNLYSTTQTKLAYQSTMASLTPEICFEKLERDAVALRRTSSLGDVVGSATGEETSGGSKDGSVLMKQRSVSLGGPVEGKKRRLVLRPIDLDRPLTKPPSASAISRPDAQDGLTSLRSSSASSKDILVQTPNDHSPSLGTSMPTDLSYPMDSPYACSAPSLSSSTSTITSIFTSTMDSAPSPVSSELSEPPSSPSSLARTTPIHQTAPISLPNPASQPTFHRASFASETGYALYHEHARPLPETDIQSVDKQPAKTIKPVRLLTRPSPGPMLRPADTQTTVPPRSLSRSTSGSSRRYTEIYDINDQGIIDLTGIDD